MPRSIIKGLQTPCYNSSDFCQVQNRYF